jgi:hypothetical protein
LDKDFFPRTMEISIIQQVTLLGGDELWLDSDNNEGGNRDLQG